MSSVRLEQPTWEIAHLFPAQGTWSEEEYLALQGNRLVEFSDGFLEVLPMATTSHQAMVAYLYGLLSLYVAQNDAGKLLFAPLRVRLWSGKFREPDIVFMRKANLRRVREEFWDRADLIMEVVSNDPDDRSRDLVTKHREYARAKIPEYWIVDPLKETIIVLSLSGNRYVVHGPFGKEAEAHSVLLPGFGVNGSEAFAQARASSSAGRGK